MYVSKQKYQHRQYENIVINFNIVEICNSNKLYSSQFNNSISIPIPTSPLSTLQMHPQTQSSAQYSKQSSIYPYYKPDNIFQRDQAYYQQLQRNTRRLQPQNSLSQTHQRQYQQVETQYSQYPYQQSSQYGYQNQNTLHSTVMNVPIQSQGSQFDMLASFGHYNEPNSPQFSRADNNVNSSGVLGYNAGNVQNVQSVQNMQNMQNVAYNLALNNAELSSPVNQAQYRTEAQENRKLKERLNDLINFRDLSEDGTEVKKKFHYNKQSSEGRTIQSQQSQIQSLLDQVNKNNIDIGRYRNAIVELQKSMNNIQSVDREIYKQLKGLSNRDQELLDRATSALARGAPREEVATILERIIS